MLPELIYIEWEITDYFYEYRAESKKHPFYNASGRL